MAICADVLAHGMGLEVGTNTEAPVLVTGGAGFIGSHIVARLCDLGRNVIVVDDLSSGHRHQVDERAQFHQLDICDGTGLCQLFETFQPRAVVHLAAQTSVSVSVREPLRDAQVNILGTLQLLAACRQFQTKHLVFSSTGGAMYGDVPEGQAADENCAPRPSSPYGCAKAAAELYLRAFAEQSGAAVTVLRYANVYGPRQDPHGEAGVVAIFCQRMLRDQTCSIYAKAVSGDDGCLRDYVDVDDVARASCAAAAGQLGGDGFSIFNVGTGVETSTASLFRSLAQLSGYAREPECGPPRPGDLQRSVLDAQRCWQALDHRPVPLAAGLERTMAWFRAQPEAQAETQPETQPENPG